MVLGICGELFMAVRILPVNVLIELAMLAALKNEDWLPGAALCIFSGMLSTC